MAAFFTIIIFELFLKQRDLQQNMMAKMPRSPNAA